MVTTSKNVFPYESLTQYSETIIQCPICQYYLKINPQIDSMNYRLVSNNKIHFLTNHKFNKSYHSIIIEYYNYSFSKIISYQDNDSKINVISFFPLFHLIAISEYQSFRDRVLELESNNNNMIINFKDKLSKLEIVHNNTIKEKTNLKQEVEILKKDRLTLEQEVSEKVQEIELLKYNEGSRKEIEQNYQGKIEELQKLNTKLEKEKEDFKLYNISLEEKLREKISDNSTTEEKISISKVDPKFIQLFEQERQQKRNAILEKKESEEKLSLQEEKFSKVEKALNLKIEEQDKHLKELLNEKDALEHSITINYEKKISSLTLELQDKMDQITLLNNSKNNESQTKTASKNITTFDRQFREEINKKFVTLQKRFNEIQYDLLLSFYNSESIDPQIRNAFEKFFSQLITRANNIGKNLLRDEEFTLFKGIYNINSRLKFSNVQKQSAIELQALEIVFSDLCAYIFAIIKAMKAHFEGDNFLIIPDDAEILRNLDFSIKDDKIQFSLPKEIEISLIQSNTKLRIFRPISELYRNSFIFITAEEDYSLSNNTYQLLPNNIIDLEDKRIVEIENFFSEKDSFQLGSFYDGQYLMIQKIEFQNELNLVRNFIEKYKLKEGKNE